MFFLRNKIMILALLVLLLLLVPIDKAYAAGRGLKCGVNNISFVFDEQYSGLTDRLLQFIHRHSGLKMQVINGKYCFVVSDTQLVIIPGVPVTPEAAFQEIVREFLLLDRPCKPFDVGIRLVSELKGAGFDVNIGDSNTTYTHELNIIHLEQLEFISPQQAVIYLLHDLVEAARLKDFETTGYNGEVGYPGNPSRFTMKDIEAGSHYNALYATARYYSMITGIDQGTNAVTCQGTKDKIEILYIFKTTTFSVIFTPRPDDKSVWDVTNASEQPTRVEPSPEKSCAEYQPAPVTARNTRTQTTAIGRKRYAGNKNKLYAKSGGSNNDKPSSRQRLQQH